MRSGCVRSTGVNISCPPAKATGRPSPTNATGGDAATNKQVKLIMDLARTRKMNLSVVERLCQETCGVSDVYGLTKHQASAVIDRLTADNPAPAGRR